MSRTILAISIGFLLLCSCDPRFGCVESNFTLASDSRLPKWYSLPSNYSRDEVTIEILFYLGDVKIVTYGPEPERKKLKEQIGTTRPHPITEIAEEEARKKWRQGGEFKSPYPGYMIITVNGIEEVFEHRSAEKPILYVTDDPNVTCVIKDNKL